MPNDLILNYESGSRAYSERMETPPSELQRKDINLKVPNDGYRYVQVLHDWDVTGDSRARGYKYSFPAIANNRWLFKSIYNDKYYDYVSLPEKWQWLLWDLWKWSVDGLAPTGGITGYYTPTTNTGKFAYTTPNSQTWYYVNMVEKSRAFTDSFAPEVGGRDYVTNRNPTGKPYEWLLRTTTGNLCRLKMINGREYVVEALDITKPPPTLEWLITQPHLLHWATEISGYVLPDGRFTVSNFPQAEVVSRANNLPFWGTPIPLLSLGGTISFDRYAVKEVFANQSYSPYYPEK